MTYTFLNAAKDMWKYLDGFRLRFSLYTILRFISGVMEYVEPFLLGLIITYFTLYEGGPLTKFYILTGLLIGNVIIRICLRFFAKYNIQKIGVHIRKNLRMGALKQLLHLNLSWHENQDTGEKIEKISEGANKVMEIFHNFSNAWLAIFTSIITGLIVLAFVDRTYFIFCLFIIAVYFFAYKFFFPEIIRLKKEERKCAEKVSAKIYESSSNITSIKSIGAEEIILNGNNILEDNHIETYMKSKRYSIIRTVSLLIFLTLTWGIFILMLGKDFLAGHFAVGMILTYSLYFNKFRQSLHDLVWEINTIIESKVSFERLMEIFQADSFSRNGDKKISTNWKKIVLDKVIFSYNKDIVLKNVTLEIPRNKKIAIIGKSGSGKSTIAKLLLNLYSSERVKIDSTPIQEFAQEEIQSFFSIVLQDSEVFNETIEYNITLGKTNLKELHRVVKASCLDEVIQKLPLGLKTHIGEKGYKLSGGQRQRLAIARALYSHSKVLILDEATSSLDTKTERKIVDSLIKNYPKKTQIIIAHRMSTIEHVDYIYVLSKGKVIAQGTFKDLKRKGFV